jgi:hypothetical protein
MTQLKFLRLSREMTQSDLQNATQVPRWKISLAERGIFKLGKEELNKLGAYFQIDPRNILADPEITKNQKLSGSEK